MIDKYIYQIVDIVAKASDVLMSLYNNDNLKIDHKADGSPVTEADYASNKMISEYLIKILPEIPVISEEGDKRQNINAAKSQYFWLLDPLDGTKGFIKRNDNFAICLALVKDGVPIFGVLAIPSMEEIFFNIGNKVFLRRHGKERQLQERKCEEIRRIVVSNRANKKLLSELNSQYNWHAEFVAVSSAYKFAALFKGEADAFVCINPMREWDIAAGHAILSALGGKMQEIGGAIIYGDSVHDFATKHFIARVAGIK